MEKFPQPPHNQSKENKKQPSEVLLGPEVLRETWLAILVEKQDLIDEFEEDETEFENSEDMATYKSGLHDRVDAIKEKYREFFTSSGLSLDDYVVDTSVETEDETYFYANAKVRFTVSDARKWAHYIKQNQQTFADDSGQSLLYETAADLTDQLSRRDSNELTDNETVEVMSQGESIVEEMLSAATEHNTVARLYELKNIWQWQRDHNSEAYRKLKDCGALPRSLDIFTPLDDLSIKPTDLAQRWRNAIMTAESVAKDVDEEKKNGLFEHLEIKLDLLQQENANDESAAGKQRDLLLQETGVELQAAIIRQFASRATESSQDEPQDDNQG